jgi:hypothetical protein
VSQLQYFLLYVHGVAGVHLDGLGHVLDGPLELIEFLVGFGPTIVRLLSQLVFQGTRRPLYRFLPITQVEVT